jgi:transposase
MKTKEKTTTPVQRGNFDNVMPEFGRAADVQKHFGIRRGTAYNLLREGKIRGVLLRIKGKKSGVRLFEMESVRQLIRAQMGAE